MGVGKTGAKETRVKTMGLREMGGMCQEGRQWEHKLARRGRERAHVDG